jgi:two-component system response regulator YesN
MRNNKVPYKILIADDEYLVRERLKRIIDFKSLGLELLAVAEDGQEAFEVASKGYPDIAIIDINMPFMNGLELVKAFKKLEKEPVVIILSGYDDFSYAQEALRVKVSDYLVKPVVPQELHRALSSIVAQLDFQEMQKDKEKSKEKKLQEQQESLVFQNLVISGELNAENTPDLKRILALSPGNYLHLVVLRQASGVERELQQELCKRGYGVKVFPRLHQGFILLVSSKTKSLPDFSCLPFSSESQISYSGACSSIQELCCANIQCERALLRRFFSIGPLFETEVEDIDIEFIENLVFQWDQILNHGAFESAKSLIDEHLRQLQGLASGGSFEKYLRRSLQRMDKYLRIQGASIPTELWSHVEILHILDWFENLDQFSQWFQRLVESNIRHSLGKELRGTVSIGERVKHIIEISYADSSLDLQTIALKVCGHPNYISTRFKEETGQGIAQYLKQVRLQHAKALLETMNCQDTAWAVGFTDPYYFSKCFKQAYGVCPNKLLGK